MRPEQLEAWVLSVVDRVKSHQPVEDSRVELKAEWPDPKKATRRLAGHVNASGGESVLWICGLDERNGVVALEAMDFAAWHQQLASEFDGISPAVQDLVIPTVDGPLVALLFDTSRRPYVVKNPAYGLQQSGPVSLEVPWREGTAIRSARREDLLRMLVPSQMLPSIELLEARVWSKVSDGINRQHAPGRPEFMYVKHLSWGSTLKIYVTPKTQDLLVLPVHKADVSFSVKGDASEVHATRLSFRAESPTVNSTDSEAVITGPGRLWIEGYCETELRFFSPESTLQVAVALAPAGQDRPAVLVSDINPRYPKSQTEDRTWSFKVER